MNRYLPTSIRAAALLLVGTLLLPATRAGTTDIPAWIEKSNANAKVVLDATNHFSPEGASSTGIAGFDDKVSDLGPGSNERTDDAIIGARDELKKRMMVETDALVRQDLEILVQSCDDTLETNRLQKKHLAREAACAQQNGA